jgi:hypothetical protein
MTGISVIPVIGVSPIPMTVIGAFVCPTSTVVVIVLMLLFAPHRAN